MTAESGTGRKVECRPLFDDAFKIQVSIASFEPALGFDSFPSCMADYSLSALADCMVYILTLAESPHV
jgi:hypothetical protein